MHFFHNNLYKMLGMGIFMRIRKNTLIILLIFVLVLTLAAGCSKTSVSTEKNSEQAASIPEATPTEVVTITPTAAAVEAVETEANESKEAGADEDKKTSEVAVQGSDSTLQKPAVKENESNAAAVNDTTNKLNIKSVSFDNEIYFSLEDLKSYQAGLVEDDYFSLNNYGTKKYFHFKGISLWYLLSEKAAVNSEAAKITIIAEDGYSVEYTIDEVKRNDYIDEQNPEKKYVMIVAWEENGKEYNAEEGSPFKLVVGQKETGDINKPNWVQNIKSINVE